MDKGYYVSDLKVTFNNQDLELGFEAGSENGNFFRQYNFNPLESEYQFLIPEDVSQTKKINIEITYAKKAAIDITYQNYEGNQYDDDHVFDVNNYGSEKVLVSNYLDGDIVLRNDNIENGTLLKLQFDSLADYNYYKSISREESPWIRADTGVDHENYIAAGVEGCNDNDYYCYVIVTG